MSSDYRPRRGGSNSNGQRRNRGGRRHQGGGQRRSFENGSSSYSKAKPVGFFARILAWFRPAKKSTVSGSTGTPRSNAVSRPEKTARVERPIPASNPEALTGPKLYIGNLSYDTVESDLFDLFSQAGAVKNVEVVMDRNQNRSKGFGFVEMEALETAKAAVVKFNRTDFMGRQIIVSGAKTERRERSASDSASAPEESAQA